MLDKRKAVRGYRRQTPRAGEIDSPASLPREMQVGLGVINPRTHEVESPAEIVARVRRVAALLGPERIFLNPDCGFGTFADRPAATAEIAFRKLRSMAQAAASRRSGAPA